MGLSLDDAERFLAAERQLGEIHEAIGTILTALTSLGAQMTKANDALTTLKAQLADTTADVRAKLDQLTEQLGDLPADAQATLDDIKAGVAQLDETVGDADGSDTPAPGDGGTPAEPVA